MDVSDEIRLARNRNVLRETVIFKYIAPHLLRDQVINNEEFQLIKQNQTKQAQMDKLLELLTTKSHGAFLSFVSSLETDYSWLVDDLRKSISAQDLSSYYQSNTQNNKICSNDVNDNHIHQCQLETKGITTVKDKFKM